MSISVTDGKGKVAVVAVGGNALISDKQHEDVASQVKAVEETCKHIANMIDFGPGFGNLTQAYYADPRTIGLSFSARW